MKSYVVKIYIEETSTRLAKRIGEHIGDLKGKEEKKCYLEILQSGARERGTVIL